MIFAGGYLFQLVPLLADEMDRSDNNRSWCEQSSRPGLARSSVRAQHLPLRVDLRAHSDIGAPLHHPGGRNVHQGLSGREIGLPRQSVLKSTALDGILSILVTDPVDAVGDVIANGEVSDYLATTGC